MNLYIRCNSFILQSSIKISLRGFDPLKLRRSDNSGGTVAAWVSESSALEFSIGNHPLKGQIDIFKGINQERHL